MRAVLVLAALAACDPAVRPFRPGPVQGQPSCVALPALPPDQPVDAFPRFEDLDGDGQRDYIVEVPATCDVSGSCDHVVFVVRESCVLEVGRVHAAELDIGYSGGLRELIGLERAVQDGAPALRKTRWVFELSVHRYVASTIQVCTIPSPPAADPASAPAGGAPGPAAAADNPVLPIEAFSECGRAEPVNDPAAAAPSPAPPAQPPPAPAPGGSDAH